MADVVVIGGGVAGLSTARALVELGMTDVLVLERDTVGSGGSGKSSGIVRCHYGIPSLAAMAWHALPVLENAAEILGAPSGYTKTGYLVGVGPPNLGALRANVAMQQDLGIEVELVGHDTARELWPSGAPRRLRRVCLRAPRRVRRRAPDRPGLRVCRTPRRGAPAPALPPWPRSTCGATASSESSWRTAAASAPPMSSWRPGPGQRRSPPRAGVDLPVRAQRAQILLVDPGRPVAPVPVFSDLVSLQYVRTEGTGLLLGDSDHSDPEWSEPDGYRERVSDDELAVAVPKFADRFPGLDGAALTSSYAGCYDVTPDYNPVIGPSPVEGLWLCAGFSGHGYKISPRG